MLFRTLFEQLPCLVVVGEPDRLQSSLINGITQLPVARQG